MGLEDYLDVAKQAANTALASPFPTENVMQGNYPDIAKQAATTALANPFSGSNVMQMEDTSQRVGNKALDLAFPSYADREVAEQLIPHSLSGLGGMYGLGLLAPEATGQLTKDFSKPFANETGSVTLGPGPESTPTASPWFSRLTNTLQAKLPEKADVGQIKNIVSTLPKEEVDWRGLNDFLEQKHGLVPKAEVMEQLKQNPVEIGETKLAGTREDYPQLRRAHGGEEDLPQDVLDKADELQREEADRALEDWYYEPGEGYGVEPIDMSEANIEHGTGQVDLWGKPIEPLPEKYIVKYNDEPVLHDDLSNWNQKKSVPNEEGHAVFSDENDAQNAYYEHIEEDENNARDEVYRDWLNEHPVEDYYEDAKNEVGYVPEDIEEPEQLPGGPGAGPTKYENYSTPGGENYREVLMTLPPSQKALPEGFKTYQNPDGTWGIEFPSGTKTGGWRSEADAIKSQHNQPDQPNFQSGHWEQPNVLAHIRFKDFADPASGTKTLLVDEIQSDWHQQGREKGYQTSNRELQDLGKQADALRKEKEELLKQAEPYSSQGKNAPQELIDRVTEVQDKIISLENAISTSKRGVPQAPFKKNWHELAFKRALQEAVAGGYDEMAWTTGEQQADRYNLAKQVKSIEYTKEPTGDYYVTAKANDGRNIEIGTHPAARLPDVVGKDLADKIIAGHGEPTPSEAMQRLRERGDPTGVIQKDDSWYITFKGKLPEDARAIRLQNGDWWVSNPDGKDLSHGQFPTKEEALEAAKSQHFGTYISKEDALHEAESIKNMIRADDQKSLSGLDLKIGGEGMKGFYDDILPSYANKYLKKYGVKVEDGLLGVGVPPRKFISPEGLTPYETEMAKRPTVHKIKITPEMKADILGKGQPMWQVPAMIGAGAVGAAAGAKSDQEQYAGGGIVEEDAMPFQSQAQRAFMYAKHPKIAERFQAETPKNKKLPEHVKKMNRGGVVGDWKDDLSDYMDEHFAERKNDPQYFADGGVVSDDATDDGPSFSDRISDFMQSPAAKVAGMFANPVSGIADWTRSMAPKAMGMEQPIISGILGQKGVAPSVARPPLSQSPAQGPVFNPKAGLPPSVTSAPAVSPDPSLQRYLGQQSEMLNKYGPEQQMALEQAIQKQRSGFLPNLANAGAGLADAIMQGVARAGPSNFQANLQNRVDKSQEGQRQAMEKAQTGELAKMKEEMQLAQMDPTSPMSKMAQRAYGQTLKTMPGGQSLTDAQIGAIPASVIGDILAKKIDLSKALAEIANTQAFREASIGVQKQTHEELQRAHKAEEAEKAAAREQKATETLAAQGPLKRLTNFVTQNPAQKQLQREAAGEPIPTGAFEPDVLSYASTHNISPEQAQLQKERRLAQQTGGRR